MAEAVTEETVAEAPVVPEETAPEPEQPPVVGEPDEDGEPGGSDGASVYARKKAREAKQLRADLEQERQDRIRAEERAKLLEQERNKPAPAEKTRVFTLEEIEGAFERGEINAVRAAYLIAHQTGNQFKSETLAEQRVEARLEQARTEVFEWCKIIPAFNDPNTKEFKEVAAEYHDLVADGLPDNFRTRARAARNVYGSLEKAKQRQEVNTLSRTPPRMPVDGNGGQPPARANDHTKAPAEAQDLWNKMGLSAADRAKDWARLQKK
jgi:hypothetical protein